MISSRETSTGICIIFVLGITTGCVLTKSQLAEVKKFATASQGYDEVVSAPIHQYGQLLVVPRLYATTIVNYNEAADRKAVGHHPSLPPCGGGT